MTAMDNLLQLPKQPRIRNSLLLWLFLLLLPLGISDYTVSQLALYFCYGLFAMSLAFIWGQNGLLCLGQAIFFGVGAYTMSVISLGMLDSTMLSHQFVGFLFAMLLPMLLAGCIALLLFRGSALDGAFLGLVTLALAVVFERLFANWSFVGGSNGLFNIPPLQWQNAWLSEMASYYVILCLSIFIWLGLVTLKYSSVGLLMQAVRDNEHRSAHLGIASIWVKSGAFILSAAISGLAGALFVTQFYFVSPDLLGFRLSTEVLIWVAVAGRFSCSAAFFGAIGVRLLENYLGDTLGDYWLLCLGALFILVVLYFPKGLLSRWLD